jgi:hypothetical protein
VCSVVKFLLCSVLKFWAVKFWAVKFLAIPRGEYVSIPLAGRERLLRSIGSQVPQDCSAEGPRESQEGS